MHYNRVSGNGNYGKMPANYVIPNYGILNGSSLDVTPLEHLFVTKFSKLTIDDEYKYNLAYLVTQKNGVQSSDKSPQCEKRPSVAPNAKPFNRIHLSAVQLKNEPLVPKDFRSFYRPANNRRQKALRSKFPVRQDSPIYNSSPESCNQTTSDLDDQAEYEYSPFKKTFSKPVIPNDFTDHLSPPKRALISPGTHYSGLNPHISESPRRTNLNLPSCTHDNFMASNFISNSQDMAQRCEILPKSIKPCEQLYRGRLESNRLRVNAANQLIRDDLYSQNVSTRVQASKAPLKPKQTGFADQISEKKSSSRNSDDQKTSRDSSSEHNPPGLRRSITFSAGRLSRKYQDFAMKRLCQGSLHIPWIDQSQFTDICFDCGKRIYPVDRISTGERVYHKACFRCATCQRTLLVGNFASLDGVIFCKPHYIEQFRISAGRYELRPSIISK
ncbi:unnamed protein product [Heterobilharzia americana]|nr:unnamed protein product [Heterobilharzia americana]